MKKLNPIFPLFSLALGMLACRLIPGSTPTETVITPTNTVALPTLNAPEPAPTITATSTETPTIKGPCRIVSAGNGAIAYTRPSLKADVFGQMAGAGFPILVMAQTAGGWLGFDPGVAQAANTGVFRNRWVQTSQVQVEGDCDSVPVVVGPPPGVCFSMPMGDTPVYASTDLTSTVLFMLSVGQYAAVLGTTGNGWAQLDLGQGNSGSDQTGWVTEDTLNFNGPCENLPAATP